MSKKIAYIDADPLLYIIGSKMEKEQPDNLFEFIEEKAHSIITYIATSTNSTHVRLAWSGDKVFREDVYLAAPYKNRGTKPAFVEIVDSTIEKISLPYAQYKTFGLEADDLLSVWAEQSRSLGIDYVVASPDKDLDQIPGERFKYDRNLLYTLTPEQAYDCLNMQLLTGDSTDGVLGIPGMGPVKARKLLDTAGMMAPTAIFDAYVKHFGPYYGPLVYEQTRQAIMMMTSYHPAYPNFSNELSYSRFTETEIIESSMLNPFEHATNT